MATRIVELKLFVHIEDFEESESLDETKDRVEGEMAEILQQGEVSCGIEAVGCEDEDDSPEPGWVSDPNFDNQE